MSTSDPIGSPDPDLMNDDQVAEEEAAEKAEDAGAAERAADAKIEKEVDDDFETDEELLPQAEPTDGGTLP